MKLNLIFNLRPEELMLIRSVKRVIYIDCCSCPVILVVGIPHNQLNHSKFARVYIK